MYKIIVIIKFKIKISNKLIPLNINKEEEEKKRKILI